MAPPKDPQAYRLWRKRLAEAWLRGRGGGWPKGKSRSKATKEKISASLRGNIPWNVGKQATAEARRHQSESHRPGVPTGKARGAGIKGTPKSSVWKAKMSIAMRGKQHAKGRVVSPATREKIAAKLRGRPLADERVRKILKANSARPNKAEAALFALLTREYPGEWAYCGDGSVVLGGRCPDFFNVNGRKALVELFGNYWHRGEDPEQRKQHFAQFGYTTVVIWESELKTPEVLRQKLAAAFPAKEA